ncbi:MAG: type II toxin-antitoxin system VapC family toxin [Beijerinckiaceae bacterium]
MRILLDTHIALWSVINPKRLDAGTRSLLATDAESVFVSAVSIWEIAIKRSLPKRAGRPVISAEEAARAFREAGYSSLAITPGHAAAVESLPMIHADPFDRMLVAQALSEPLRLVTADKIVAKYSETIIMVR